VDTALKPGPLFQDHAAVLAQPLGALRIGDGPGIAPGGAGEAGGQGAGGYDRLKRGER